VKDIVPLESIRSILQSASGELWREGEFRLEMVWKILCQQPGLSASEVAPPLLVFKSFEKTLDVQVRIPDALSAIPVAERDRLGADLTITEADFAEAVQKIHALAAEEAAPQVDVGQVARAAADSAAPTVTGAPRGPTRRQKLLAGVLGGVALVGLAGSLWYTLLRDTSNQFELTDVAPILQISDGRRVEQTLAARISDPRWETLPPAEQQRLATQVFERERPKGIHVLTLTDSSGRLRASVSDANGGKLFVTVH
jgi:hypothetical protein